MIGLKENINDFLYHLEKIRGYSSSLIFTYIKFIKEQKEMNIQSKHTHCVSVVII